LKTLAYLVFIKKHVDDTIPDERVIPIKIVLPTCNYINNARHFIKNKVKRKGKISVNKTIPSPMTLKNRHSVFDSFKDLGSKRNSINLFPKIS